MKKLGRPKKTVVPVEETPTPKFNQEVSNETETVEKPKAETEVKAEKKVVLAVEKPKVDPAIAESRKALDKPLEPGQKLFESPEGYIMIGESEKNQVWCRHSNNGKGSWINPRR